MRGSLTAVTLLFLGASCIPSYRMVHDGNLYFERCYGADFDRQVDATKREECWQAWLGHYTRHQPAHRVDYAMRRIEALQNGEPMPTLPGLAGASGNQVPVDPGLSTLVGGGAPRLAAVSQDADAGTLSSEIPNGCLEACNTFDSQCVSECPSRNVNCRNGCTRERAICLGGCH